MDFATFVYLFKMIVDGRNSYPKQFRHSLLWKPECIGVEYNLHLHLSMSSSIHKDGWLHAFGGYIRCDCRTKILASQLHHLLFGIGVHSHSHTGGTREANAPHLSDGTTSQFCHLSDFYEMLSERVTFLWCPSLCFGDDAFEVPVFAIAHYTSQLSGVPPFLAIVIYLSQLLERRLQFFVIFVCILHYDGSFYVYMRQR